MIGLAAATVHYSDVTLHIEHEVCVIVYEATAEFREGLAVASVYE